MHKPNYFSIAAMARAMLAGTWGSVSSIEHTLTQAMAQANGEIAPGYHRIPGDAMRDLTLGTASAGGYLVGQRNLEYLPALQNTSVALRLGAVMVPASPGGVAAPRGTTGANSTWLSSESTQITETAITLGQVVGTMKLLGVFFEVSRLLLMQSNADQVIRTEAARAAGAALDLAIIQGTGAAGQPTGIVNTAGIGAFTGASLSQAAARNAQRDVSEANAIIDGKLGYVTTPAVAEVLSTRQRFTGASTTLWEGPSHDGVIEGVRAMATGNCPAATAIYGDWSSLYVVEWDGGVGIQIDPFTKFTQSIVGVRLILPVDVIVTRAAAFSVATSVS